ncbi:hypothetical protein E4U17_007971 [Claviceps sp. LM77 group G4]|nr:hypothetical protein E4U17_007971 [Claviceps sp. LM77 group G4]KAG6078592.1 hypothetical protein E4U16_001560 [Claviceps sp. LM84 group G4]KAG6084674.1 hypothetical protein E4U33_002988 [Claviceps sp. LM78 group G4]KAG6084700.1 hypothetical protein E4U33_003016 [Claviceps sp. LM78 group G4]
MTFYQPSPRESLEDPSGVEQPDPSSPPSMGSPPVLYYSDAFGNLFATIPGPTGDHPSLLQSEDPIILHQPQPQCLMPLPLLNPEASPLECNGGYAVDMWNSMDAYETVSPASASSTITFEHGSQVLSSSLNAHFPPHAIQAGRVPLSVGFTDPRVSFSPQMIGNLGDDSHGPQEHLSLPRPLNDQRQHHDHTPPYMTPQAIRARELILRCDFPRDRSPQPSDGVMNDAVAGPDTSNIAMRNDTHTSGRN